MSAITACEPRTSVARSGDELQQSLGVVGLDPIDAEIDEAVHLGLGDGGGRDRLTRRGAEREQRMGADGDALGVEAADGLAADERVLGPDEARAEELAEPVALEDPVEQAARVRAEAVLGAPPERQAIEEWARE